MSKSISELVTEYRQNALQHGAATATGDHKSANEHHDGLMAAVRRLREKGTQGSQALLPLLDDQNQSVRCWAATHCLDFAEGRARRTLVDLAAESGIVGFTAETVLSEWDKGTLSIP